MQPVYRFKNSKNIGGSKLDRDVCFVLSHIRAIHLDPGHTLEYELVRHGPSGGILIISWVQWYMDGKSVLSTKTFFVFLRSHIFTEPSAPRDERHVLSYENVTLLISIIGLCAFWILIRGATVRLWSQIWIWPSFAPLAINLPFLKIHVSFRNCKSTCKCSMVSFSQFIRDFYGQMPLRNISVMILINGNIAADSLGPLCRLYFGSRWNWMVNGQNERSKVWISNDSDKSGPLSKAVWGRYWIW